MDMQPATPKLRKSKQRDSIYGYLCGTKSHPSADMIYESLKGELDNLSLGTVYRNLVLLESLARLFASQAQTGRNALMLIVQLTHTLSVVFVGRYPTLRK